MKTDDKREPSPASAVATGSPEPSVNIALPRGVIEALLTNYIAEYNSTAEILKFNHDHEQWDLLTGHLLINAGRAELIRTCAAALAQENI